MIRKVFDITEIQAHILESAKCDALKNEVDIVRTMIELLKGINLDNCKIIVCDENNVNFAFGEEKFKVTTSISDLSLEEMHAKLSYDKKSKATTFLYKKTVTNGGDFDENI